MTDKNEKETLATSLNSALEKSKGLVFAVAAVVVLVIVAVAVIATVKSKATAGGIEQLDTISYNLTNISSDNAELTEEDIAARQNKALEELSSLVEKSGVVGLRANMLVAEIKFAQKNFDEARAAWLKAAEIKKNAYTAPLCYYNAAVCSENLGDTENAILYYKSASEDNDFLLVDHALFSLGRVNESVQKYDDAKAAYEKLSELHPTSSWAQMAQSQLISLKVAGKIQ